MPGSTISLPVERIATEGLAKRLDFDQPERRERADAAGVEQVTGGQNGLPARDVGALPADVLTRVDGRENAHVVAR